MTHCLWRTVPCGATSRSPDLCLEGRNDWNFSPSLRSGLAEAGLEDKRHDGTCGYQSATTLHADSSLRSCFSVSSSFFPLLLQGGGGGVPRNDLSMLSCKVIYMMS